MKTVCCSNKCEKQLECANHAINNEGMNYAEDFYNFGSGSLSSGGLKENFLCSELGNWGMFVPIEKIDVEVKVPFPFQYLEKYFLGEMKYDDAINSTVEEANRLIKEYIENHVLKT